MVSTELNLTPDTYTHPTRYSLRIEIICGTFITLLGGSLLNKKELKEIAVM